MRCSPLLFALPLIACGETTAGRPITRLFVDHFDRSSLGEQYFDTGGHWAVVNGALRVQGAHNHPLWLVRPLPRNAAIDFTARSTSRDGDIKVEVFGDGHSYATADSYTATSYVIIFGGWHNALNVIARMNEHGEDRKVRREPQVEPGRPYTFHLERRGNLLSWKVDGRPMLDFDDASPLAGPGHQYFAFNDWEAELTFDDLSITPLEP
jgi:hypothetical protein